MTQHLPYAPPPQWMEPRNRTELEEIIEDVIYQCLDDDLKNNVKVVFEVSDPPLHHMLYCRVRVVPGTKEFKVLIGKGGETYKALQRVLQLMARTDGYALTLDVGDSPRSAG